MFGCCFDHWSVNQTVNEFSSLHLFLCHCHCLPSHRTDDHISSFVLQNCKCHMSSPFFLWLYFMMLSISILCSTEWKTGEQRIGKNLEGSHHGITEMLFQHFPGESEKNHKTSVIIASFLAQIRTTVLQNPRPQHYHYTYLFTPSSCFLFDKE
jgi:hypothetical protein